jgi:hypothetical protein
VKCGEFSGGQLFETRVRVCHDHQETVARHQPHRPIVSDPTHGIDGDMHIGGNGLDAVGNVVGAGLRRQG